MGVDMTAMVLLLHAWPVRHTTNARPRTGARHLCCSLRGGMDYSAGLTNHPGLAVSRRV
jgi:hypothetical protein